MTELPVFPLLVGELILLILIVQAIVYLLHERRDQRRSASRLSLRIQDLQQELRELEDQESDIRLQEQWFRRLFNQTCDMVLVHTITSEGLPGRILEANDVACNRLGYSRDELLEMSPLDIEFVQSPATTLGYTKSDMVVLPDDYVHKRHSDFVTRPARQLMDRLAKEEHISYERVFEDRNGSSIPVAVEAKLIELRGRRVVLLTARDISARQQTELELDESRRRFNDFFMRSPIGIAIYDADRRLVDVNRSCLRMFGVPDRTQFGNFDMFGNPFISAEVKGRIAKGESVRFEVCIDFSEASHRAGLVTTRTDTAYFDVMVNNMGPNRDFLPRGYFAQVQDITERRNAEAELRANERQLRQAERMEAIGSLASGIAHDFNNILTPIVGYAELTMRTAQDSPAVQKCMSGIIKASGRAKELIGQILTHCREADDVDEQDLHPVIITPIIKEVLVLQKKALSETVNIKRILKAEHDTILGNATKIHQVLMNICTNAGHAMQDCEECTLEVSTSNFVIDRRSRSRYPELDSGRYLRIAISDTGTGMDEETARRVFEPFFTTKKKGEGTGMGLSVVQGIVRSFRGTIKLDTEPGKGSAFTIIFPTVEKAAVAQTTQSDEELPTGTECIIVVDDEEDILDMTKRTLESLGYTAVTAASAIQALAIFRQDPGKFDLVVTDQVMPVMSGEDLSRELIALRPDLPILLVTGFPDNFTEDKARDIGIREFLLKPLATADLATAIRRNLDGDGAKAKDKQPKAAKS